MTAPASQGSATQPELPPIPENDVPMTFFEHIADLRTRLIRCVVALIPGIGIAWMFKELLMEWLLEPMRKAWVELGLGEPTIHFASPIEPFVAYLKLAAGAGLLLASPWWFWQLWGFISPGLYDKEKRLAFPFVLASTSFFLGGVIFGYMVVFPLGFETFLGFSGLLPSEGIRIEPTIMVSEYLSFATRMLLAFGLVFEVPVIVSFLAMAGIVNWKQLLSFGRWWVLIAALLSSMLTPPDVGSQVLMIVPLVVLYFLSVILAYFLGPKPPPTPAEAGADS